MKEITIGDKPLDNQWDAFVAIEVYQLCMRNKLKSHEM